MKFPFVYVGGYESPFVLETKESFNLIFRKILHVKVRTDNRMKTTVPEPLMWVMGPRRTYISSPRSFKIAQQHFPCPLLQLQHGSPPYENQPDQYP